jgi:hypothetical protein
MSKEQDPAEVSGSFQRVDGWIALIGAAVVALAQVFFVNPTTAGWVLAGGLAAIGVLRIATAPLYVKGLRWVGRKGEERRARRR